MSADRVEIGARLRAARKDRGWDKPKMIARLREAAGDERKDLPSTASLYSYLRRWENGDVAVSERYRMLLARAFGLNEVDLFGLAASGLPRRDFVSTSVAVGVAFTTVGAVYPESGCRVSLSDVDRLRRRMVRLRRLDDILGGADTFRLYAAELETTSALANEASYTDVIGRALLGVVAEQAQQAGWAAFDAGMLDQARSYFQLGLTAASDAGDTSLIANSLALLAYQKVSAGVSGTAEAAASCRIADSDSTPAAVRALLHERSAWAYAMVGKVRETEEALGRAGDALAGGRGRPDPDWAVWVDEVELEVMTGRCWSTLRQPDRAIPVLQHALRNFDETCARDKALYLTWLADAHLDRRDVDEATEVGRRALDLSADVASVRPRQRIKSVLGRLKPYGASEPVAAFMAEADWIFRQSPDSPSPDMPPNRPAV